MLQFFAIFAAVQVFPVGSFEAIEAHNGAHVVVRQGAVQRVSMRKSDSGCTNVSVASGGTLVINRSGESCRDRERTPIEIETPHLSAVSVANGGSLETLGAFPAQGTIRVGVQQGGVIDIRSLAADQVVASIYSGGRIFLKSRKTLDATVESGGAVTYWGDPGDVRRSVHHGGVVTPGAAEDAEKPLSELAGPATVISHRR